MSAAPVLTVRVDLAAGTEKVAQAPVAGAGRARSRPASVGNGVAPGGVRHFSHTCSLCLRTGYFLVRFDTIYATRSQTKRKPGAGATRAHWPSRRCRHEIEMRTRTQIPRPLPVAGAPQTRHRPPAPAAGGVSTTPLPATVWCW